MSAAADGVRRPSRLRSNEDAPCRPMSDARAHQVARMYEATCVPPTADILEIVAGPDTILGRIGRGSGRRIVCRLHVREYGQGQQPNPNSAVGQVATLVARPGALPFPSGSFDLIILDGTLDRLPRSGFTRANTDPRLALLRHVRDVLKPGGTLAMAVDNRLHMGRLRYVFAELLGYAHARPRRASRSRPSRSLTYWGYLRIARRAALAAHKIFAVVTDADGPTGLIANDAVAARHYFRKEVEKSRYSMHTLRYWVLALLYVTRLFFYLEMRYLIILKK